ncbi:hypothetical protein [uncultured Sphingomonas sp.]|uniref:hypothetical protein n=1 Tax=uncultured Sphingomonas sp. TaxID=158754 RepID=UPI0026311EAC|nr:hypothetical protein [uncultured Sphingomonas sp.]
MLEQAGRLGLAPVSQERLHLLLFYCAVLTPVHGMDQPVPKILKHRDRPFYPEAQDEVVALVVRGFVATETRDGVADLGWDANGYWITDDGVRVADRLRATSWGRATARFVRDLVIGFAELDPDDADDIVQQDALFRDDRLRRGDIRNIVTDNQAANTARQVADYEVDGLRPDARDSIALYFEFLQARRAA